MGLLGSLFGGGKSKQSNESGSKAFDFLSGALQPGIQQSQGLYQTLGNQLGGSFDDFKRNMGFDFSSRQGERDRIGTAASKGLLNSGSLGKALAQYQVDLDQQYAGNWLDRLGEASKIGTANAGVLAGAGQFSKGTGKSTDYGKGIIGTLFG